MSDFTVDHHGYEKAMMFAMGAHEAHGQTRKGSDEPYYKHCVRVMKTVSEHDGDADMIKAALLHDTVEDTQVSLDSIEVLFGKEVRDLVYWVTNVATKADGNRAARTALNIAHVKAAPARAQTIKVADIMDNTQDVVSVDPKFAKVYLREKHEMLRALEKAHPELRQKALIQVEKGLQELGLEQPRMGS